MMTSRSNAKVEIGKIRDIDNMIQSIQDEVDISLPREIEVSVPPNTFLIPDELQHLIIGSTKGWISIYDLSTGEVLTEVDKTNNPITSLSCKEKVLIAGDSSAKIFMFSFPDLVCFRKMHLPGSNPQIKHFKDDIFCISHQISSLSFVNVASVKFSHQKLPAPTSCFDLLDNSIIVGFEKGLLELYNASSFTREGLNYNDEQKEITIVKLFNRKEFIAAAFDDFTVSIFNQKLEKTMAMDGFSDHITGLEFIGHFLITSSKDSNAIVWELQSKKPVEFLNLYDSPVTCVQIVKDSIYTSQKNNMVLEWKLPQKVNDFRYDVGEALIKDVEFFQKKTKIMAIDEAGELFIWDYATHTLEYKHSFKAKINRMSVSKCETFALISSVEPALYKMNLEDYSIAMVTDRSIVTCIKFHSNKRMVVTGDRHNNIIVWESPSMKSILKMKGHSKQITSACLLEDKSQVLTGSKDCSIRLWDFDTGKCIRKYLGHTKTVTNIRSHRDGAVVISSSLDATLALWDVVLGIKLYTIQRDAPIYNIIRLKNERFLLAVDTDKVTVIDLDIQNIVTSIKPGKALRNFAINNNETIMAIGTKGSLYIKNNLLADTEFNAYGEHEQFKYKYFKYIKQILSGKVAGEHRDEYNSFVITPFIINIVHIFAYMNSTDRIRLALNAEAPIFNSKSWESPLNIALHFGYVESINVIVKYIGKASFVHAKSLSTLENCMYMLNYINLDCLPTLYNSLLRPAEAPYLPKFCSKSTRLPIMSRNSHMNIIPEKFFSPGSKDKNVKFVSSRIPISLNIGSKKSLRLLNSLQAAPQANIFQSDFVKSLLEYKWQRVKNVIYIYKLIESIHLLMLTLYCLFFTDNSEFLVLPGLLGLILCIYEGMVMMGNFKRYFQDYWNILDLIHLVFLYTYLFMVWVKSNSVSILLIITMFSAYVKGITYFSVFQDTRYIINLIIEVLKDMKGFLILFIYSTVSFGIIFLILPSNDESDSSIPILESYMLNLGEFDTDAYVVIDWFFFILATFINAIVMLNLLIAIMSNTFERVQTENEIANQRELLSMILEIEQLYFWNRKNNDRSYLQICRESNREVVQKHPLQSSIKKLSKAVTSMQESLKQIESNLNIG